MSSPRPQHCHMDLAVTGSVFSEKVHCPLQGMHKDGLLHSFLICERHACLSPSARREGGYPVHSHPSTIQVLVVPSNSSTSSTSSSSSSSSSCPCGPRGPRGACCSCCSMRRQPGRPLAVKTPREPASFASTKPHFEKQSEEDKGPPTQVE